MMFTITSVVGVEELGEDITRLEDGRSMLLCGRSACWTLCRDCFQRDGLLVDNRGLQ